ncbi:MAG: L-fucose/L-arabinose isomerase family protein [Fidelibacterota bacterium]|nr:MAG: L-fucose/L-arabinose isomerase family protein [Candidatus Neomarinimicrobiota bacterium]
MSSGMTLGIIIGNRGFFPDYLCETGRASILKVLEQEGIRSVALTTEDTKYGSVESLEDARKCARLFKTHYDEIDGVLVSLPNFGDERAVANTLRWADLDVPILIQAFPDDPEKMTIADRGDAFCGKMSVCNNLTQYGIKYTLTGHHTVKPESEAFRSDLQRFESICRIVGGLAGVRIGLIGARPAAFNTVRFSEKLFERAGISTETIDLSEIFGRADRFEDKDPKIKAKREEIEDYVSTEGIPAKSLGKMAKLGVVIDDWMQEQDLAASTIQCWTSMEEYYGVMPCALMSIMSSKLLPSACETDAAGLVGMYALMLASGKPSAIVDWNNNYGDDLNKCVLFHCSNLPKDVFEEDSVRKGCRACHMDYQEIIAGNVGQENAFGTISGRIQAGPFTYCRISTDDLAGKISVYVGEGKMTDDALDTFGGYGVAHVPNLQKLLQYICENGFEHHVAINLSQTALAVDEALSKYLDWAVHHHNKAG